MESPPTLTSPGFEAFVLDQVQAAVTATDLTGAVTRWNRGAEILFGWTKAEALGRDFRELFVSSSDLEMANEIRAAVMAGTDWGGEFPVRRKGGGIVLAYTTLSPIRGADDAVLGIVSVSVDITERARKERLLAARTAVTHALAEAESLEEAAPTILSAVCENLGWEVGALWRVDQEAGALRCIDLWHAPSVAVTEFERVSRETRFRPGIGLPGRVWSAGRPAWIPDVAKDDNFPRAPFASREGIHGAFGFPILLGNQILGVLEFFSREIQKPDADLLQALSVIGSQIGQFMERKEAEARIRESRERLHLALEAGKLGTWNYDIGTGEVTWDETLEAIFGLSPGAFRGTFEDYVQRLHPDERGWILATVEGARESGSDFEIEHRVIWPDGSVHWIEGRGLCIKDAAGTVVAMTGVSADISERKRVDQAQRFLAEAAALLATSIEDYEETLRGVARLVVPELADWCSIEMLDPDGSIRQVAVAHVEPDKVRLAQEFRRRYPPSPSATTGVPKVLRTGEPEMLAQIPDSLLRESAPDPEFLRIARGLGLRSYMVVPMVARGRTLGAITLVTAESGRRYDQGDLIFAQEVARRAALAVDNARLVHELRRVATRLQESLLPPALPEVPGLEVEGRYRWGGEGNEVGGDFYDVFETGDGSWALAIGDVCGKGVEAAVVTSLARHTLRAVALQERKPSGILRHLNEAVMQQRSDHMFCTVCYVRLKPDEDGARLTVCSAGHPLPMVLRVDGSVETAGTPGSLLGIFPDPELADCVVDLHHGDALVLFTDGILEERRASGESFGRNRLASVVGSCRGQDATGIAEAIQRALVAFTPAAIRDDVALLVVRVKDGDLKVTS
jgi:PAS domain S-box-containing protein